jgi:hypothetical protein
MTAILRGTHAVRRAKTAHRVEDSTATTAREGIALQDVCMRPLTTPRDIAAVQYLRRELQLPLSAVSDPDFIAREKKR